VVDDDPVALAQRRVWEAQQIVGEQKGRSLAFALLELRHSMPHKPRQLLTNLRLFREHRDALLSAKRRRP
jgi:hypothetical protein